MRQMSVLFFLLLILQGCRGSEESSSNRGPIVSSSYRTPQELFSAFKDKAREWDLEQIASCFYFSEIPEVRDGLFEWLTRNRIQIRECYGQAELGEIERARGPDRFFALNNCPHSRFRDGLMLELPDGNWSLRSIELPDPLSWLLRDAYEKYPERVGMLKGHRTATALLNEFKQHVEKWDLEAIIDCFELCYIDDYKQYLLNKLPLEKAEIQECYEHAELANIERLHGIDRLFTLRGCPHPRFQTGMMSEAEDGIWAFRSLETPREVSMKRRSAFGIPHLDLPEPLSPPTVLPSVLSDFAIPPDFSTPRALFATTQRAVEARDLHLLFHCFAASDRGGSFEAFRAEFESGLEELQLIRAATLGTELESKPGTHRFSIQGWPGKQTVTLVQKEDRSWSILRL